MPEWIRMPRLALLVALALMTVSCASAAGTPTDAGGETTTTSVVPTGVTDTTTSTIAVVTTSTQPPGPPVAWQARSGVPMAVSGVAGAVVEVITPCGDPLQVTEGTPIYEVDVVIDPGHGGPIDTGAVAPTGLPEKEVNLRVGLEVSRLLNERGIPTMSTRIGDYPIPIVTRAGYADMVGAEVLVSIHHNAPLAPASEIPGVEIFVQQGSKESQRLGGLLYDAAMTALGRYEIEWARSPDAGVMTVLNPEGLDAYGMVRRPMTPSVLVELGYIANRAEAELYQRPEYAQVVAVAIADAIERFMTTADTGSGLVEGRVFRPGRGVGADQCVDVDLESSLYPDVVAVEVDGRPGAWDFAVTMSSSYDTPERYADAFRIVGDDGVVYGLRELTHDHADEQPFTRSLLGVDIPASVSEVTVEGRDQVYGWGGVAMTVELP